MIASWLRRAFCWVTDRYPWSYWDFLCDYPELAHMTYAAREHDRLQGKWKKTWRK